MWIKTCLCVAGGLIFTTGAQAQIVLAEKEDATNEYVAPRDAGPKGEAPRMKVQLLNEVGNSDGTTRGGHVLAAYVSPTLEVMVTVDPVTMQKRFDPDTDLTLIDPSPANKEAK